MRQRNLAFYVGGFLGPFGGAVVAVMVPELRAAFDASTAQVALAIPAYLVPFAAVQLVSGTLGERLGRRRAVRAGYLAYAAASLAAAFAPALLPFLVARALQGVANAFLTPLLLASLAEATPPHRLGRAMGTFGATQTLAVTLSPICGGLAAAIDWRLAFVAPALVGLALAAVPAPSAQRAARAPARLRALANRRVALLAAGAFAAYMGVTGLAFLVALYAEDAFGLGASERGLLLAAFGAAGVFAGRPAGMLVDRFGRVPVATLGATGAAACVAALGFAGSVAWLAVLWFLAGTFSAVMWAALNTLVVEAAPSNRAGATSLVSAFKFSGQAVAPLTWLSLYHHGAATAFAAAGALALSTVAFVAPLREPRARRVPTSGQQSVTARSG